MVPGSTFIYGSSLRKLILTPRASSRLPMEALARPFPSDERTPPVTKIYFIASSLFTENRPAAPRVEQHRRNPKNSPRRHGEHGEDFDCFLRVLHVFVVKNSTLT